MNHSICYRFVYLTTKKVLTAPLITFTSSLAIITSFFFLNVKQVLVLVIRIRFGDRNNLRVFFLGRKIAKKYNNNNFLKRQMK